MYMMVTVASLCAVVLLAKLLALACRHRPDLWITSEDAILCVASPVAILLLTFGGVSLGFRFIKGGLGAVPAWGWIGSGIIIAVSVVIGRLLAARLLASAPPAASTATTQAIPVTTPL